MTPLALPSQYGVATPFHYGTASSPSAPGGTALAASSGQSLQVPTCEGAILTANARDTSMARYGEATTFFACLMPYQGGYGLDAQWSDDFHHAVHTYLTGERQGYYQDYGPAQDLPRVLQSPFLYEGIYSRHRDRKHEQGRQDLVAKLDKLQTENNALQTEVENLKTKGTQEKETYDKNRR